MAQDPRAYELDTDRLMRTIRRRAEMVRTGPVSQRRAIDVATERAAKHAGDDDGRTIQSENEPDSE